MQILLFFHILGTFGLIVGVMLNVTILVRAHRATTIAQLRAATVNVPLVPPLIVPSVLLIIAVGIAMVYVGGFGWSQSWIDAVLIVLLAFAALAPVLIGKNLEALHALSARGEGAITQEMNAARRNAICNCMVFMSLFQIIAALYVMTTRPPLPEVIAAIAVAAVLALLAANALLRSGAAVEVEVSEVETPTAIG